MSASIFANLAARLAAFSFVLSTVVAITKSVIIPTAIPIQKIMIPQSNKPNLKSLTKPVLNSSIGLSSGPYVAIKPNTI